VTPDKEVTAYCRIGERSSHTWFVLKYLLGYPDVRNYDGSWTEWGNLVRTPIETLNEEVRGYHAIGGFASSLWHNGVRVKRLPT
jgi:hypothetical protein